MPRNTRVGGNGIFVSIQRLTMEQLLQQMGGRRVRGHFAQGRASDLCVTQSHNCDAFNIGCSKWRPGDHGYG